MKGTRAKSGKYYPPQVYEAIGQALWMEEQDADYVCAVQPPPEKAVDKEALVRFCKRKNIGLFWAHQIDGKLEFSEAVPPTHQNSVVNLDRKKMNLAFACIFTKGHGKIQRQKWAREADFVQSGPAA